MLCHIYDVRDQLVDVSTLTGLFETYGYSYDELRARKSGPDGLLRVACDERSLLLQDDLSRLTTAKYEREPDLGLPPGRRHQSVLAFAVPR